MGAANKCSPADFFPNLKPSPEEERERREEEREEQRERDLAALMAMSEVFTVANMRR